MDEQSKIILYKQLTKFEEISNIKGEKLMPWGQYELLDDKEVLVYASDFRDRCANYIKKKTKKDLEKPLYLELPDMNLQGFDLHDFYLHDFMPGISKERNNGKKIFIASNINLNGTNCVINMGTIMPIIISLDRRNNKRNCSRCYKM